MLIRMETETDLSLDGSSIETVALDLVHAEMACGTDGRC